MRARATVTGYPFFCGTQSPCEDDPTFVSLGNFPCDSTTVDVCVVDLVNAGPACQVSAQPQGGCADVEWRVCTNIIYI